MTIPSPNLDDREFLDLVAEAVEQIQATAPEWTDLGPGDPGMTLIEVFAHLTEVMIFRLNRVPDKAYRAYLNLIGTQLRPSAAARTTLRFSRSDPEREGEAIEIPRATRVTLADAGAGDRPIFVVPEATVLPAGEVSTDVVAVHCELVDGELVGLTTGEPGQSMRVQRAPIVRSGETHELIVGVEMMPGERADRGPAREYGGKQYAIWREVRDFADVDPDTPAFVVDRASGTMTFAPSIGRPGSDDGALALVPPARLEVRVWYATGGGPFGNVSPNTLTALVTPLPGLEVTNIDRATGGRAMEPVEEALIRGPREFNVRDRAVTARDYELIAQRSGAVSRARAFTAAQYWTFAPRGSVDVVLVPHVEDQARPGGRVRLEDLADRATPGALDEIARQLDDRRPLGVACRAKWAEYKRVAARARVAVRREEDRAALRERVLERLHQTINPLPAGRAVRASEGRAWPGWPFGQTLRTSDVYDILLAEPGVVWADRVRLITDQVPDADITTIARDHYQQSTWFSGSRDTLFRSMNDAAGWESVRTFPDEIVEVIEPYPREPGRGGLGESPGHLAVATALESGDGARVYVSRDLGETWDDAPVAQFAFPVEDLAWIRRDLDLSLVVATENGLYEQPLRPGGTPVQISVDPASEADLGFYQVVSYTDALGALNVAVAAQRTGGIYLSRLEGRSGTYNPAGLQGEDVRSLEVQYDGPATYLWAGTAAEGGDQGRGCHRARLEEQALDWTRLGDGWEGGSCWALAFAGDYAFGASHLSGVQRIPLRGPEPRWWRPAVDAGLPLREVGRFHPVRALAANDGGSVLLAGGPEGVFRSTAAAGDLGDAYEAASLAEFDSAVTLPPMRLFVSGEHQIEVVSADETRGD
jgi:hypothetical protein